MQDIHLAGTKLDHYHVAVLVRNRDEEYRVIEDYVTEGLRAGEKEIHICDPKLIDDHTRRIAEMGVGVDECHRSGQLEVISWHDGHIRGGKFNPDTMYELIQETARTTAAQGFPRVRLLGHMEWSLEKPPGTERLKEYEFLVTEVLNRTKTPALCVYDVSRYPGDVILELMRVHPWIVLDGQLQQNPLYQPYKQPASRQTA